MTVLNNDSTSPGVVVREGEYGDKIATIEPGGAGFIPLSERHGSPRQLLWTWSSPNLEFATIFLGVLAVAAFGLSFWQAVAAIVLGNGLSAISHGVLSANGPRHGVAQMVLGRVPFGFRGNALPASLTPLSCIGWFAVNSVSATFALNTLTGLPRPLCLLIVVVAQVAIAFFGHNLVHAFERYAFPALAVVFAIASVIILSQADFGAAPAAEGGGGLGGFLIMVAASFGYAAGWNPFATDYTRYLPPDTSRRAVALYAGLGIFVTCTVLQIVGAASVSLGGQALADPTGAFTGHLPSLVANLTLLAITLGAVCANAIGIYSGSMSVVTLGIKLPLPSIAQRALVALVFGVAGLVLAYLGLDDAGQGYEAFLLLIAYWIGPWLGVVLTDLYLRRGRPIEHLLYDRRHRNWAGPVAMGTGVLVSVLLFSNQELYVGVLPGRFESIGDLTFEAGFLLSVGLYLLLRPLRPGRSGQEGRTIT
jgi:NCS1 family nucleobase:cation symporter-1